MCWGRTFSLVELFCHIVSNDSQTFFPLHHIRDALAKETWQCSNCTLQCNQMCYSVPRPFLLQAKGLACETRVSIIFVIFKILISIPMAELPIYVNYVCQNNINSNCRSLIYHDYYYSPYRHSIYVITFMGLIDIFNVACPLYM